MSRFPLKDFRTKERDQKDSSSIKNVSMFPFCTPILLGSTWAGSMNNGSIL